MADDPNTTNADSEPSNPQQDPGREVNEQAPSNVAGTSRKRPGGLLISDYRKLFLADRARDNSGTFDGFVGMNNVKVPVDQTPTPDALLNEFFEGIEAQLANLGPCYNEELFALGTTDEDLWFLCPSNVKEHVCELKDIGTGTYNCHDLIIPAIYTLAKRQYAMYYPSANAEESIKWAVLRACSFEAGWFAAQKNVKYCKAPNDYLTVFTADKSYYDKYHKPAWALSGFIPYFNEFYFRAYGSCYNSATAADYTAKIRKLALATKIADHLNYLSDDVLYGPAFRWIGVVRPKQALIQLKDTINVPNVFVVRMKYGPAGQALVTTTYVVLQAMEAKGWWSEFRDFGFDDSTINSVAQRILDDPWKFHLYSGVYELPPLSPEERAEVDKAREDATKLAPITQAFCDVVESNTALGRAKVLRRALQGNPMMYQRVKSLFRTWLKKKDTSV
nr:hypothetical protein DY000_00007781 [Ipomoea trifida]